MNMPFKKDFVEKQKRVRAYMRERGYDGVILARRDNFAWFTFGGDNKIFRSSDIGAGLLLITMEKVYLFAQYMDADRILEDELAGLDIEPVVLRWYEDSREQAAIKRMTGKKVVSDIPVDGADFRFDELLTLHTPYLPWEVERYAQVGSLCDKLLMEIAGEIKPDMREQEIAAIISEVYEREAMAPKVLLVGSDERIEKFRHPNASNKRVEKLVLIHPAADKWGMHANLTRMIYFGDTIPAELAANYELLNRCLASACSLLRPGNTHEKIIHERKRLFAEADKAQEYELHYPGATTGYYVGSPDAILENRKIVDTMCYDWFITVRGAKVEELCMASVDGGKALSATGRWPVKRYTIDDYSCDLPVILQK